MSLFKIGDFDTWIAKHRGAVNEWVSSEVATVEMTDTQRQAISNALYSICELGLLEGHSLERETALVIWSRSRRPAARVFPIRCECERSDDAMKTQVEYPGLDEGPWSRWDEIKQRLGNCKRFLVCTVVVWYTALCLLPCF